MNCYFLKHKNYRDVCFRVLKQYDTHNRVKLKIEWWNLGFVNSYAMGITQNTEILHNDYDNWLYTTDVINCLRNANWRPLK